jgi:hypothetical protein
VLEWAIKPHADRAVHELSRAREVILLVIEADEYTHVDHVVGLFDDDLARAMLVEGERHAKLELTDVSLAEGDRPT